MVGELAREEGGEELNRWAAKAKHTGAVAVIGQGPVVARPQGEAGDNADQLVSSCEEVKGAALVLADELEHLLIEHPGEIDSLDGCLKRCYGNHSGFFFVLI